MKRQLIITADDFGFSAERNKGIVEAITKGAAQSASLLLNCTGSEEGSHVDKSNNICLGLHLNLTEGLPVGKGQYKTLTNKDGEFLGRLGMRQALSEKKIDTDEIRAEICSQIKMFKTMVGHSPIYVDGHQHVHIHPEVVEVFASVLRENNIFITRFPIEVNMTTKSWVNPDLMPFFLELIDEAKSAKSVLDKSGIKYPDSFTGLSTMGADMTIDRLKSNILEAFSSAEQAVSAGQDHVTCELMSHPGYPTSWDFGGFNWGTDDFGASDERVHELNLLTSSEMSQFYKKNNIQFVSHKAVC